MGYLPLNISGARLLINGVDYSNELVSINVSDDSLITSSLISTNGQLTLAQSPSGKPVNDYQNQVFKIGQVVNLDIKQPNGEYIRHPRGHLYILSTSYSIENKELEIEVGCGISYALKYENKANNFAVNLFNEFANPSKVQYLAPAEVDLSLLSDILKSDGSCVYQDRWGFFQKVDVFGELGFYSSSSTVPYKFTAFDRRTCLSIVPQSATFNDEVPTVKIELNTSIAGENGDAIDEYEDILSEEFLPYETNEEFENANTCDPDTAPAPGITEENVSEQDYETPGYGSVGELLGLPEFKRNRIKTVNYKEYEGPGNQVSLEESKTYQQLDARLSGFFDSIVDYELSTGSSPLNAYGTATSALNVNRLTDFTRTHYTYGLGGELRLKVTYTYGLEYDNVEENDIFEAINPSYGNYTVTSLVRKETVLYRYNLVRLNGAYAPADPALDAARRPEDYRYNEEITYSYDVKSRRNGASGVTKTVNRSGGNLVNPEQQDYLAPSDSCAAPNLQYEDVAIEEEYGISENISFTGDGLAEADFEYDNVITEEYPIEYRPANSLEDLESYRSDARNYAQTVYNKLAADSYGFTIQEALRAEFYSWYPAYPYKLVIESENKAFYMRISAATWSVTSQEAVCSFESMMISEYLNASISSYPQNSQLEYLLPEVVTATGSNNAIVNHETALGTTVRAVTVPVLGSPPVVSNTAVTLLPTASGSSLKTIVNLGAKITIQNRPRLLIRQVSLTPLNPVPAPLLVSHQIPVFMSISEFLVDAGTITAPTSLNLEFGSIASPGPADLDTGTISSPLV